AVSRGAPAASVLLYAQLRPSGRRDILPVYLNMLRAGNVQHERAYVFRANLDRAVAGRAPRIHFGALIMAIESIHRYPKAAVVACGPGDEADMVRVRAAFLRRGVNENIGAFPGFRLPSMAGFRTN